MAVRRRVANTLTCPDGPPQYADIRLTTLPKPRMRVLIACSIERRPPRSGPNKASNRPSSRRLHPSEGPLRQSLDKGPDRQMEVTAGSECWEVCPGLCKYPVAVLHGVLVPHRGRRTLVSCPPLVPSSENSCASRDRVGFTYQAVPEGAKIVHHAGHSVDAAVPP